MSVIVDECGYEGTMPQPWGNPTAQKKVHRFWLGVSHGGYVGHGETFEDKEGSDVIWWSKGGILLGESAPRLAFLWDTLQDWGVTNLDPVDGVIELMTTVGQRTISRTSVFTGLPEWRSTFQKGSFTRGRLWVLGT
jgi:hypothetical protein